MKRNIGLFTILWTFVMLAGCTLPVRQTPTVTPFVFPTLPPTQALPTFPPTNTPPPPTATPTFTAVPPTPSPTFVLPTATPTPQSARSGTTAVALFMSKAPNFDGVWNEWKSKEYPARFLVFGSNKAGGQTYDLEGSYRVAWDNTYLYLAAKVHVPFYVQQATGANLYKGDSLEILFDANLAGDFNTKSLTGDDYQIGISPGQNNQVGNNPEAYLWFPSSRAGSLSNVKIGTTSSEGLYRVEVGIPWSTFKVTPANGQTYGFVFSISYDLTPGAATQDALVSSISTRVLTDPTTWGSLTLSK